MTTAVNGVPIPTNSEELAEILADDKKVQALFADADTRKEFLDAYTKIANKGEALSKQIAEQASATVMEMLKESGVTDRPDLSNMADDIARRLKAPVNTNPLYNPKAVGAQVDDMFETSGDYFKAIWHNTTRTPENDARLHRLRNAFSSAIPSDGGFLVPERLRAELLRVALETAVVRPRARVIPMDSLRVPIPAIDETSHASSVYGGIVAYWTEEGAALTDSSANFGRVVLDAKKLTAYTEAPNELVADSAISFSALIDQLFPEALSFYEDKAFLTGTGTGEPKGVLESTAAIEVTKQSGQAADTIVYENLVNAYSRMLPGSLNRAVWVASIDTFPELATMALSVGTGGSAVWLTNAVTGPPMTIFGRPVLFTEKTPVLGDAGDITFIDFGFYLIGDRQAMSASSSEHFKFQNDKTAFRIVERVDGRPWLNSALTPANSGPTLSPVVKIAARA